MDKLKKLLSTESHVLLDGAMGTVLMDMGMEAGAPPEEWNLLRPEAITEVHMAYIRAGSQIILTNSFGGTRFRLMLHGLDDRVVELNRAAAVNARIAADSADRTVIVGGSMGPTGELLTPLGDMRYEEAVEAFAEQATGLVQGGVDLLWIETMSDVNEVKAAVEGARSVGDTPIVATMTFDTNGHTMMGVSPESALEALNGLELLAIGGNCGNGPTEIEQVIRAMRRVCPDLLFVAKSNAGLPHWVDEELRYDGTPEVMAEYALTVRDLGARLIGACCGSSPAHVEAMAAKLAERPAIIQEPDMESASTAGKSVARPKRSRRRRRRSPSTEKAS
jgi:5-methyltetrahydrofolate--homocysteine methyltransferase